MQNGDQGKYARWRLQYALIIWISFNAIISDL